MPPFPSLNERELRRVLERRLGYATLRQRGSHRRLVSQNGFPPLTFAFHSGQSIPPGLVRKILVKDVGLSERDALELLR